ncbi:hypothetical protein B0H11DRAFT_2009129 [Mycena galericulata]|nr:hypothetical protein B0H11DRAFT_2065937 [Mycena galericulata]KAJ7491457.1 hypothetical protein B0H11DRAFT_2009129 [Mycena galericulata]
MPSFRSWRRPRKFDGSTLSNVFAFSVAIVGEVPIPGLKAAATALLDIIRRVGCIKESKAALNELAADMEYLLFLSSKVRGNVGASAVEKLKATIAEIERNLPQDKHKIVAFFLADDTKTTLQALANQLDMAIRTFQIELQLNTDEKVEGILLELKQLKHENHTSQSPCVKQDLQNLELNAKRTLSFTVISVSGVDRNIAHAKMWVTEDFNSLVVGRDGIVESMHDVSINTDGDMNFTTVAGSPADLAAWSDVLKNRCSG